EKAKAWDRLIFALERAAEVPGTRAARDHLIHAARVYEDGSMFDRAVETWRRIEQRFGQSEETIDALARLLGSAQRWNELAAVLEHGLELTLDPVRRQGL